ncbi:MAG: 3-oxoadipate enol-lactonase [Betaproteobacteria bacterium]|nr:MAG: 3-oxoadipate enol-lactonase [Betaproteobacteria bacterium]
MKIKANGIDINYEIEGEGPWVTMSHSLACNLHMWDDQMAVLTKKYKVLRFDTRGHGQSDAPAGEYTLEQMADDAKALLDALQIRQTHWVGLSMGGMIAQAFVLKYPGVFQSMVLADTTSRRPPDAAKMWGDRVTAAKEKGMAALVEPTLARWFTEPYRNTRKDVMERIAKDIRSTPVAGFAGCCQAISKVDYLDRLKDIKVPSLIMVGEHDHGTPPEAARAIQQNLAGSDLKIIPSAAHLSNIEQVQIFNDAMMSFLDRVSKLT